MSNIDLMPFDFSVSQVSGNIEISFEDYWYQKTGRSGTYNIRFYKQDVTLPQFVINVYSEQGQPLTTVLSGDMYINTNYYSGYDWEQLDEAFPQGLDGDCVIEIASVDWVSGVTLVSKKTVTDLTF